MIIILVLLIILSIFLLYIVPKSCENINENKESFIDSTVEKPKSEPVVVDPIIKQQIQKVQIESKELDNNTEDEAIKNLELEKRLVFSEDTKKRIKEKEYQINKLTEKIRGLLRDEVKTDVKKAKDKF